MLRMVLVTAVIVLAVTSPAQTVSDEQVPVTPSPMKPEWRLGFDLGNMVILEAPELNPRSSEEAARGEALRFFPNPADFRLSVLPFSKTRLDSTQLLNTRQWAVLDQHGNVRQREFRWLAMLFGTRTSSQGGFHLVSSPVIRTAGLVVPDQTPAPENIVFGVAGLAGPPPQVRTRLTQTPWKNDSPVENPDDLPAGYPTVKLDLATGSEDGTRRVVYGSSMLALVRKRVEKLWLLNYGDPDLTHGLHAWGIFTESPTGLNPLYIFRPSSQPNALPESYHVDLFAGIDADRDGNDDLVVEAQYANGRSYKVIALVDGIYRETRSTYYRGRR